MPGTTVGPETRQVTTGAGPAILVDLPGTLALDDRPTGGAPFWQLLLDAAPDAILVVADAGNLARHLPLTLACRDLGLPIVLAANLSDEASTNGVEIDTGALAQLLVAPVHRTVGRDGTGVAAALEDAVRRGRQRLAVRDAGARDVVERHADRDALAHRHRRRCLVGVPREVEDAEGDARHAAVGEDVVEANGDEGHRLVDGERQAHRLLAQDLDGAPERLGLEHEALRASSSR